MKDVLPVVVILGMANLFSVKVPDGISPVAFYGISILAVTAIFVAGILCVRYELVRAIAGLAGLIVLTLELGNIIVTGHSYFGFA